MSKHVCVGSDHLGPLVAVSTAPSRREKGLGPVTPGLGGDLSILETFLMAKE